MSASLLYILDNGPSKENNLKLVEAIEEASGIAPNKTHGSEIPGDGKQNWTDVSKAKESFDYRPNYDLAQGLDNFVKWYKKFNSMVSIGS